MIAIKYIIALVILVIIYVIWVSQVRVVFHTVSWCGHCVAMKPVWADVVKSSPFGVTFETVDGDKVSTPGVDSFPTIIMHTRMGEYKYPGGRDYDTLRRWIVARGW